MKQVILDLGQVHLFVWGFSLRIYGYGLMLVLGFLCGIYLARWRARRFGENPDAVTSMGLLALVAGVLGARLAYVIEQWDGQFARMDNPLLEVLNITSGGLIYYGGVALATAAVLAYLRLKRLPVRRYLDVIAPSLMLGLAFGRAGCLLNGCCYGGPCREDYCMGVRFPYASRPLVNLDGKSPVFGGSSPSPAFSHQVSVPPERGGLKAESLPEWLLVRDAEGMAVVTAGRRPVLKAPADLTADQARQASRLRARPLQPAQAFGIVNALLLAGVLLAFCRLRTREGQAFLLMVVLYPITRFVLEGLRGDNFHDLPRLRLTHNQWVSIGMFALGLILWLGLRRLPARAGPSWRQRLGAAGPQPARARAPAGPAGSPSTTSRHGKGKS